MSTISKDPEDMTDEELLERVAALDEDQYPVAKDAQRALRDQDEGGSS
jgi:hypothetical protein